MLFACRYHVLPSLVFKGDCVPSEDKPMRHASFVAVLISRGVEITWVAATSLPGARWLRGCARVRSPVTDRPLAGPLRARLRLTAGQRGSVACASRVARVAPSSVNRRRFFRARLAREQAEWFPHHDRNSHLESPLPSTAPRSPTELVNATQAQAARRMSAQPLHPVLIDLNGIHRAVTESHHSLRFRHGNAT